ncbi:unnamed protein product, partial [Iphiclides podalirius]
MLIFLLLLVLQTGSCVIYRLNDSTYYKMPPVFHLDDYAPCLSDPEGVYCMARIVLVSDTPSELLNIIHNYSEHRIKHYNHRNKFLMIFSIKRNWEKLLAPVDDTSPRLKSLKGFNGARTIVTALVITVHSFLPFINDASNTRDVEAIYDNVWYHTFISGTPIVQAFFLLSGFLLAYNIQIKKEKRAVTWQMIPMGIWLRWLRLTPCYALVLAITSTWLRFAGSGPLWHEGVLSEVKDCRRDGWQNLLYINNYFDNTQCMAQCWYLAAEMQLYCLGLFICVLSKTNTARKVVLSLLFIVGVVIPGAVTYIMDLDGVLIVSPETSLNYFVSDSTFNNIYKRGHTNMASYIIGLSMGFIAYHLIDTNFEVGKYKKYLWTYQLLFPSGLLITWMGSIFYRDAPRDPAYVRALSAALIKPIFSIILGLYLLGLIFKCDKINRRLLEWNFWTITSRLTYSAFLLHILVMRTYIGTKDTMMTTLFMHMV